MSRTEYMRELDALLHGISKEEREEAMQYYNDYFDDAGSENEEKVIEELGSPAKLADTIRAGVNGNTGEAESYGEYGERVSFCIMFWIKGTHSACEATVLGDQIF